MPSAVRNASLYLLYRPFILPVAVIRYVFRICFAVRSRRAYLFYVGCRLFWKPCLRAAVLQHLLYCAYSVEPCQLARFLGVVNPEVFEYGAVPFHSRKCLLDLETYIYGKPYDNEKVYDVHEDLVDFQAQQQFPAHCRLQYVHYCPACLHIFSAILSFALLALVLEDISSSDGTVGLRFTGRIAAPVLP